ncbi:1-(5-phosphoribosyl)-5-[(5-phosphoribosylamino)methylideneamino]imidazole-4-carboxamide isomerase [Aquimonas sp.]|jgi:phosphoribosylformimino-5-aminoimidazole carboxamide ribotide isomerase|uniref:1-(5-phosphoribosyl)-5-[(5- phosphoribosylamino)methylideneamino]imidazole-4- carboxamide isomerase n=1 Tax=Aquimonas sp. TaxID=1872588 RepID=UPI0037BE3727
MSGFTAIPAIDVRGGRVVRLKQGDYAQETRYPSEPLALALRYAEAGADWLHLVDLDAAQAGGYTLAPLVRSLREQSKQRIQSGGGVRSEADVEALLAAGVERVVVGSLAVKSADEVIGWLQRFGAEHLCIALDTRQDAAGVWRLPTHGWTESAGEELFALVDRYRAAGLRHLLCTDIARDGMLNGPNFDLYRTLIERAPEVQLIASGGVAGLDDIRAARAVGAAGVVLGKALLDGCFSVEEALAC